MMRCARSPAGPRCQADGLLEGVVAENVVERVGEDGGQRRQGGGTDDPELDPAPQEAGQPAVALAQEDIVAARARIKDGDLGVGQRASSTSRPPRTHTTATRPEYGTATAMACGFLKTPEPMTVPTTMAVAMTGPSSAPGQDGK